MGRLIMSVLFGFSIFLILIGLLLLLVAGLTEGNITTGIAVLGIGITLLLIRCFFMEKEEQKKEISSLKKEVEELKSKQGKI